MKLFAISDLHLSLGADKPMDVFRGWENYTERLAANWKRVVTKQDVVVLPGDLSWSLKLEDAKRDFEFLEALPGRKLLIKGNHDLWWSTAKKLHEFFDANGFSSVEPVYNNCAVLETCAVAGTRGWFYDGSGDKKVLLREAGRLETSLRAAEETGLPVRLFLHYPPVYGDFVCREIFDVIKSHGIQKVYHGHIHGSGFHRSVTRFEGVELKLISCDCIDFTPLLID